MDSNTTFFIDFLQNRGITFIPRLHPLGDSGVHSTPHIGLIINEASPSNFMSTSNFRKMNLLIVQASINAFRHEPINFPVKTFLSNNFNTFEMFDNLDFYFNVFDPNVKLIFFTCFKAIEFYQHMPLAQREVAGLPLTLHCVNGLLVQNENTISWLNDIRLNNHFPSDFDSNLGMSLKILENKNEHLKLCQVTLNTLLRVL